MSYTVLQGAAKITPKILPSAIAYMYKRNFAHMFRHPMQCTYTLL